MKCISLKLEEEQLEKLKEMVRESGKNRSELIRNKIFNSDTSDTGGDTQKFKSLLKFMYEIMNNKMDWIKIPTENDKKKIKEVRDI